MKSLKTNKKASILRFFPKFSLSFKIFLCLVFLFMTLSLISYDIKDTGNTYPPQTPISNWMGKAGAIFSYTLYLWLGQVVWMIPLGLVLLIMQKGKFSFSHGYWVCWCFFLLLWVCTLASFWEKLSLDSDRMPSKGGLLGLFLSEKWQLYFGKFSALFLLCTGIILAIYAFTIALEQKYWKKLQHQGKKE